MKKRFIVLGLVILAAILVINRVSAQEDMERKLETYLQVLDIVKHDFVEKDVDDQKLVYGSIRGMLEALDDPYTRFVEPKSYQEMQIRMNGSYSGIGIYIGIKDSHLTVIAPIAGTPAFKAGLKAGDKIRTIDKKSTKDMSLEEAVSLIRGPKGTHVALEILSRGKDEVKKFDILRENIKIEPLTSKRLNGNIAYIKLNTFENVQASKIFETALRQAKGADGLVIDLRGNGGGLLQNAIDIGSMFIDDGLIVQTIDREGRREQIPSTGRVLWRKPTVVLINESSASASEILAGALKDNNVAKLVGTKSFGKASVQNVRKLNDGSALLVTIAKYLTPDGTYINKVGITPEVVVEIPTAEAEALVGSEGDPQKDAQLKKAISVLKEMISRADQG